MICWPMIKGTMGTKLPRKLEQKMQIVGERKLTAIEIYPLMFLKINNV